MSWFNTGLNTLKGQLTNLAQEVLAEVDRSEEELNPDEALEIYKKQNEELLQQCSIKDSEIASLRQQITNFEKNGSLESSWICESDNFSSDIYGKNDNEQNSESSSGGEMITIPLDYNTTIENDSWEKIHKNIDEKDQKLKKLLQKILNYKEKIVQLTANNQELTENLETLDSQHNIAVQELLELKNDLQSKLTIVNSDYEVLKEQHQNLLIESKNNLEDLKVKLETRYENEIESLNNEIKMLREQKLNLKKACEAKDQHMLELIDKINSYDKDLKDKEIIHNEELINLKNEIKKLNEKLTQFDEESNRCKDETKYPSELINKQDNEDDFIVLHNVSEVVEDCQKTCIKPDEDVFEKNENEEKFIDCNYKTTISLLQSEIKNLENKIQLVENENENLKSQRNNQDRELDVAFQKVIDLENQTKMSCENYEKTIKDLQDSIVALTNNKKELEKNIEILKLEVEEQNETQNNNLNRLKTQSNERKYLNDNCNREVEAQSLTVSELNDPKNEKYEKNMLDVKLNSQEKSIDMESSTHNENMEYFKNKLQKIEKYLLEYFQIDINQTNNFAIEKEFKDIYDKITKMNILENDLKTMVDEVKKLKFEMKQIEHEKETLRADITHYEEECEQLMKNNEILLNELKNIKQNKLETISEKDEESIAILEKQLDDCNSLNKTLEEEYNQTHKKLKELEFEKKNCSEKLKNLQEMNENLERTLGILRQKNEVLEEENCRLIFEINEMKTDDKKSAVESQMLEYKTINQNLEEQLKNLNKDYSNVLAEIQTQKTEFAEYKKEYELIVMDLNRQLEEQNKSLTDKNDECKNLIEEVKSLEIKLSQALEQQNSLNEKQFQEFNNKIQHLTEENYDLTKNFENIKEENNSLIIKYEKINQQLLEKKQSENKIAELCQEIKNLTNEKNNLIEAMTIKHNESVQYYNEIQRLDQLLKSEIEKSHSVVSQNCENCLKMQKEISEIKSLNKNEIEKLNDQINFLKEKSNILTTNLLTEQTNQKLLSHENAELIEKNNNLVKDLERLRQHLVEQEESHTQEIVEMQNTIEETKNKMTKLEMQVKNSSNAYTSASIRANQQAETLQTQYVLISQQRDELSAKLNEAEDRELKNQVALFNLQCALEQFQTEKEKDILSATNRIRKELQNEQDINRQLQAKISSLNQQLTEANQGLLAATRLSNQLEDCQLTITSLKEQVSKLENMNQFLEEKLKKDEANQENNIEKGLVKSLIIGYIVSNNQNDKAQILKMISSVLDFNQIEMKKVGLNQTHSGWFSSILYDKPSESNNSDGLIKAFVEFLEKESQPRSSTSKTPNLLNISLSKNEGNTSIDKSKILPTQKTQSNIQPILLSETTFEQFPPTRNSSSILKDILNAT